jgi:hypothetical protein
MPKTFQLDVMKNQNCSGMMPKQSGLILFHAAKEFITGQLISSEL